MTPEPPPALDRQIELASRRQSDLLLAAGGRRALLPLRYWRQAAHFTTPAADEAMGRKAIEGGTRPMARILERFGVSPVELADHLEVDADDVSRLLELPRRAPLVMLDGEDAQALNDSV